MQTTALIAFEITFLSGVLAIFGAAWAGLYWFSAEALSTGLSSWRFKRLYRKSPEQAIAFAERLVTGQELAPVLLSFGLLLVPPLALVLPIGVGNFVAPAIGFLGLLGILGAFFRKSFVQKFRKGSARHVISHLLTKGKSKDIERVLESAFRQSEPKLQTLALEYMREWGSPPTLQLLQSAGPGYSPQVQEEIASTLTYLKGLGNAEVLLVAPLDTYFQEFAHITEEIASHMSQIKDWNVYKKKIDQIRSDIDHIILSQTVLRTSFPDVFCRECRSRAEEIVHEEWRYVRCRSCKEAPDLVPGIGMVIGEIGGEGDWVLDEKKLTVAMWDQSETARPAELDLLRIKSNSGINYDWAVSAVVESMKNRFSDEEMRVKVEVEPGVTMSRNTEMLLDEITARDLPSPSNFV